MTEEEAIEKSQHPEKLTDEREINDILGFLNAYCTDIKTDEWGKQLAANQHRVKLLSNPDFTNTRADAEWRISEEYIAWQEAINLRQKFNAYRNDLRSRQDMFLKSSKYIRNNY